MAFITKFVTSMWSRYMALVAKQVNLHPASLQLIQSREQSSPCHSPPQSEFALLFNLLCCQCSKIVLLRSKSMLDPSEAPMVYWVNEYRVSCSVIQWELQDEFAVQNNEIATLCIIKRAGSSNYPPPEVGKVAVPKAAGKKAEVEGTC